MEEVPRDPVILLSWVNMKLRDFYPDLPELCASLGLEQEALEQKLEQIGYRYDKINKRFV